MSKLLVVFGATGQQGGSVASHVATDPILGKEYRIRAITRDPSKPAAQALAKKGMEVEYADSDDIESLQHAFQGAHTVFGATFTVYDDQMKEREIRQGKAIADAALQCGVQHLIYSTLPHAGKNSDGKHTVGHFDSKAEVESYIRGLPIRSTFFAPGCFMQNFHNILAPRAAEDGTYCINNIMAPQTRLPLIDIAEDAGKFVGGILDDPEGLEGKALCSAIGLYSMEDIAQVMSHVTGKTVTYKQIPVETSQGLLPPAAANHIVHMFLYFQDAGYYGSETAELVSWAAKRARGKLTTLEEFLNKCPLKLQ
ncbi:hypothetical protein VTN49DRAFT_4038 [Thermomyces lanuginosus]|uniref:uncharacterized protein n=1 Tax=Thermomyces lanuginosus TaxID=5541 RepID=UPI0037446F32